MDRRRKPGQLVATLPPARTKNVRLDRALSKLGLASRSEARQLIAAGSVVVSGRVVTDPSRLVVPEKTTISIDGTRAERVKWRTIALHKTRGTITTRRDPEGRPTVFDLVGDEAKGMVAVGRLDLASTGLLLLTTDTQLAAKLTDPGNSVIRRYVVTARGRVTDEDARRMEFGIGELRARAVRMLKRSKRETHLIVELTEGKEPRGPTAARSDGPRGVAPAARGLRRDRTGHAEARYVARG